MKQGVLFLFVLAVMMSAVPSIPVGADFSQTVLFDGPPVPEPPDDDGEEESGCPPC